MMQDIAGSQDQVSYVFKELAARHPVLNEKEYAEIAEEAARGAFTGVPDMYAAIIAKGMGKQVKQGLYRDYIKMREDTAVMHGSLDVAGTVRNRLNRKYLISCESDILSVNNPHNRLIKTVIMFLLRRDEVNKKTREELKKLILAFDGVDETGTEPVSPAALKNSRCGSTYNMLTDVCTGIQRYYNSGD